MNPFQIMSEPIRRRIVEVLASGEHTSTNLAEVITSEFGVTRGAMQNHLRILRENGWVDYRQEEATRFYHLEDAVWRRLDAEVRHLKSLWKQRIGTYEANDEAPWLVSPRVRRPKTGERKGRRGHW
ncbi:ArsR/SmtB family transcription factor [Conyzicola sp.]|uniref:ArsR/SmtB family transcription factor n=1 Tax=Conyzicola sp. TaxID=1969404 RepID=UPI00398A25AC